MEHTVPLRLVTILDYWRVIRHYWWIIGILVCLSVAGTWVWCKMSPRLYEARVTMIPSGKSLGGSDGISSVGDKERGSANAMETLHALLVSRRIAENIIIELNLKGYYGVEPLDQAIPLLQSETDVRASPFKTYEVTVLTKDPVMAALIANAYVPNLDRLYREVRRSVAKHQMVFLTDQIAEKTEKLTKLKYKLKEFRTKGLALTMSEVAKSAMEDEVNLHSEIVGREAQLAVLRSYASPNHTMIIQLRMQIAELRQQLAYLEESRTQHLDAKRSRKPMSEKLFTELEQAPSPELDVLGLMGQIRLEEASFDMLVGMIEQVRLTESYDVPALQQLDRAIPAKFPSRPKTLQSLKAAAALSLILGIMLAFFFNYLRLIEGAERDGEPQA